MNVVPNGIKIQRKRLSVLVDMGSMWPSHCALSSKAEETFIAMKCNDIPGTICNGCPYVVRYPINTPMITILVIDGLS